MKKFIEHYQELTEKQIQYGNNANYGQIVFFAGGAGSGKGFSISNFIDAKKFKIRDVDNLKKQMSNIASIKQKYPDITSLDLKKPEDVGRLHAIAKAERLPEKQLDALLSGMKDPSTLPNIIFDITMKDFDQLDEYVPRLIAAGYKPENIHITWVLTDYSVAIVRNKNRERVVPADIMLKTHTGAALTVGRLLQNRLPQSINGSVTVVLNNPEETTYYDKVVPVYKKTDKFSPKHGEQLRDDETGKLVNIKLPKDFKYITIKKAGRSFSGLNEIDEKIKETLYRWVVQNAPADKNIQRLFA